MSWVEMYAGSGDAPSAPATHGDAVLPVVRRTVLAVVRLGMSDLRNVTILSTSSS